MVGRGAAQVPVAVLSPKRRPANAEPATPTRSRGHAHHRHLRPSRRCRAARCRRAGRSRHGRGDGLQGRAAAPAGHGGGRRDAGHARDRGCRSRTASAARRASGPRAPPPARRAPRPWGETRRVSAILTTYSFVNAINSYLSPIAWCHTVLTCARMSCPISPERPQCNDSWTGYRARATRARVRSLAGESVSSDRSGASWRVGDGIPLCQVVGSCRIRED